MENKKGSGIFLGVIGVTTLIVAIIGATFAFFSAQANSAEQAITATGATLQLGLTEDIGGLKQHLIPAADKLAEYAAITAGYKGTEKECLDDNKNEICGVYDFIVGNPSFTTQQDLYGKVVVASNAFTNLVFQVYDETNTPILDAPVNFNSKDENNSIDLGKLATLLPSSKDDTDGNGTADTREGQDAVQFDSAKPETYTEICTYGEMYDDDGQTSTPDIKCINTNVRRYKLVMWIHEIGSDQTEMDSKGASMAAGVVLTSASDTEGVTGIISAANGYVMATKPE